MTDGQILISPWKTKWAQRAQRFRRANRDRYNTIVQNVKTRYSKILVYTVFWHKKSWVGLGPDNRFYGLPTNRFFGNNDPHVVVTWYLISYREVSKFQSRCRGSCLENEKKHQTSPPPSYQLSPWPNRLQPTPPPFSCHSTYPLRCSLLSCLFPSCLQTLEHPVSLSLPVHRFRFSLSVQKTIRMMSFNEHWWLTKPEVEARSGFLSGTGKSIIRR